MTGHRRMRIDGIWVGLGLMILSAAVVVFAIWLGLSILLSLHHYVESVPLP